MLRFRLSSEGRWMRYGFEFDVLRKCDLETDRILQMNNVPTFLFTLKELKLTPSSIAYRGEIGRYLDINFLFERNTPISPTVKLQDFCSVFFSIYYYDTIKIDV